jgi:hypothetical protein
MCLHIGNICISDATLTDFLKYLYIGKKYVLMLKTGIIIAPSKIRFLYLNYTQYVAVNVTYSATIVDFCLR